MRLGVWSMMLGLEGRLKDREDGCMSIFYEVD